MPFRSYDRNQSFLFPPHLSDWVTAEHPARVFSDFIDKLLADAGYRGGPNLRLLEKTGVDATCLRPKRRRSVD